MSNIISTETIALHWIGNILLWSFATIVIPFVPNGSSLRGGDGQWINTKHTATWLYTPSSAFPSNTYPNVTVPASYANVDMGANALRETCNVAYGTATALGAVILLCRAASNTVIVHPLATNHGDLSSPRYVAYVETGGMVLAWTSTTVGIMATALGQEPKTGWAVVGWEILAMAGYVTCYVYQMRHQTAELKRIRFMGQQVPDHSSDPSSDLSNNASNVASRDPIPEAKSPTPVAEKPTEPLATLEEV